jgi:hypothetical protein
MSQAATQPQQLLVALRAQGITHVYVNYSELNRLQHGYNYMVDANWSVINQMLKQEQFAKVVHAFGQRIVYELGK